MGGSSSALMVGNGHSGCAGAGATGAAGGDGGAEGAAIKAKLNKAFFREILSAHFNQPDLKVRFFNVSGKYQRTVGAPK